MNVTEYIKFRTIDEKAIQMLTTGDVYFSSPNHFNDPFDCTHSLEGFPPNIIEGIRGNLSKQNHSIIHDFESVIYGKSRRINNGVVSFCGRHDSSEIEDPILNSNLWGHYANDHKGICIGFSPYFNYKTFDPSNALNHIKVENGRQFTSPSQPGGTNLFMHITSRPHDFDNLLSQQMNEIVKVSYLRDFSLPIPDWNKVKDNYANDPSIVESKNAEELINKLLNDSIDIKKVVSTKHSNWEAESEYRLFGGRDKSQSIGAAISSLTFGLGVSREAMRYLTSIVARFYGPESVELYKMTINRGILTRIPLEVNDASPSFSQCRITF